MTGIAKKIGGMVAALVAGLAITGVAHADTLRWTGEVDDTGFVRIDGREVRTDGNMRGVRDGRYDVDGRLPNRATRVRLSNTRGRGDIQILEQPSAQNNYTTVVKIRDWQAGSSRYGFQLTWDNPRTDRYEERYEGNNRNKNKNKRDKQRGNGNGNWRDRD
ncbi:MAG: hypothetical protein H7Y38_10160, partial [Armatimonadetes bacterium]|nr:hypothetical protein [Armatimonadota bacterium]